jgi:hypothetical protein
MGRINIVTSSVIVLSMLLPSQIIAQEKTLKQHVKTPITKPIINRHPPRVHAIVERNGGPQSEYEIERLMRTTGCSQRQVSEAISRRDLDSLTTCAQGTPSGGPGGN